MPTSLPPINPKLLDQCAAEPIHIPGFIQPHGFLVGYSLLTSKITHVSSNISQWFDQPAAEFLGKGLEKIISPQISSEIVHRWRFTPDRHYPLLEDPEKKLRFTVHKVSREIIVEGETFDPTFDHPRSPEEEIQQRLSQSESLAEFLHQIPALIQESSGYDRVMLYQFDPDWNGKVVAEACQNGSDSYFGLQFPAADIPAQARQLYTLSRIRQIPRIDYTPVPLHAQDQLVLDLSFSKLRSVSPIHLTYLRNMQVTASMSISILIDGKLWGLIACHHPIPLCLSQKDLHYFDKIGVLLSDLLAERLEMEEHQHLSRRHVQLQRWEYHALQRESLQEIFLSEGPTLMNSLNASGGVLILEGRQLSLGVVPKKEFLDPLLEWLSFGAFDEYWSAHTLVPQFPEMKSIASIASGLLALRLPTGSPGDWMIWFRPEVPQTVDWAGNPTKGIETDSKGEIFLHPRKSFARWKEEIQNHSLPWLPETVHLARFVIDFFKTPAGHESVSRSRPSP